MKPNRKNPPWNARMINRFVVFVVWFVDLENDLNSSSTWSIPLRSAYQTSSEVRLEGLKLASLFFFVCTQTEMLNPVGGCPRGLCKPGAISVFYISAAVWNKQDSDSVFPHHYADPGQFAFPRYGHKKLTQTSCFTWTHLWKCWPVHGNDHL